MFQIQNVSFHSAGVEIDAKTSIGVVDNLIARITALDGAGLPRPGLIRMRSRDFRMPEFPDEETLAALALIELGEPCGYAALAGKPNAGTDDPEYGTLFVPPALWRWESRSGNSSMVFQPDPDKGYTGVLHCNLSHPDFLLAALAAMEEDRICQVNGANALFENRAVKIVCGKAAPRWFSATPPLFVDADESEPGIVFPAWAETHVRFRHGLLFDGADSLTARRVYTAWASDPNRCRVAIPVEYIPGDGPDYWSTYRAVRRAARYEGAKF
jgi:hypothetical protein